MNVPKDPKRQEIKDRIAAAQARNAKKLPDAAKTGKSDAAGYAQQASQKAGDATDSVTSFVKEHPVATIAGGVALGILISGLFKGSPTRKVAEKGAAKTAGLAAIGSEIAYHFANQVLETVQDASRAGADRLDDLGDEVSDTARALRRDAGYKAATTADAARIAKRDAGKAIGRKLRR